VEGNSQNDQRRQRQETAPGRERIVEIVDVETMGSGISQTHHHVLFWIVAVIGFVDSMRMIMVVAMVMHVVVCMTMSVGRMRMGSMRLVG
jgi:hypothetical protein